MISYNCKNFNTIFENNFQLCENNVQLKDILNGFSILSDIVINKIDNISGDNTILNKIRDYGTIRNINDYSEYKCPLCGKREVLHFHKTYERNLIFYYNDCEIICRIDIIVLECSYCKEHNKDKQHYHALLPSFILPYHTYSSYIIMDTLYYGLTKEQFNKMLEERNISYQLYYKWLKGLDKIVANYNMSNYFFDFSSCTTMDLSYLDTSLVTNMAGMFQYSSNLIELDLSNFNTRNTTNMLQMFMNCSKLVDLNLNSFNTLNVTMMAAMFGGCNALKFLDLTSFNTSNTTVHAAMFLKTLSLTEILVTRDTWTIPNSTIESSGVTDFTYV